MKRFVQMRWLVILGGTLLLYAMVFAVRFERTTGMDQPISIKDWVYIAMFTVYCPIYLFVASQPRIGEMPVCRRCDFLYDAERHPDHCPRCHADLTAPNAIIRGHQAMPVWRIALGAALLIWVAFGAAAGAP